MRYVAYANVRLNLPIPSDAYYLRASFNYNETTAIPSLRMVQFSETLGDFVEYKKEYGLDSIIKVAKESLPNDVLETISNIVTCKNNDYHTIIKDIMKSQSTINIKMIGDSIMQGVGASDYPTENSGYGDGDTICTIGSTTWKVNESGSCMANYFKDYMTEHFNCIVKNYGTRSFTSTNIKAQINLGKIIDSTDDVIICMIGTNDKWSGSLETLKSNLQWLIDKCKTDNKKLILISAPMSTVEKDTTYNGSVVKFHNYEIDNLYNSLSYENNMNYIPMYQLMLDYCKKTGTEINSIFADGLHPNDTGYKIMFELLMYAFGIAVKMPNASW